MDVRQIVQNKLDDVLLPDGVIANHLRRVKVDRIADSDVEVKQDEYVVFSIISSHPRLYGDGEPLVSRIYVDINYYYTYAKTDPRYADVCRRVQSIKRQFLQDARFRLANDTSDIPDIDSPSRGVNIEFAFWGATDDV